VRRPSTRLTGVATVAPKMSEQPPDPPGEADVDPRITFASERTFLAWMRTSLALIAGGVAVGATLDTRARVVHLVIAVAPILFGGVLATIGYRRWQAFDVALKTGAPLPVDHTLRGIAVLIAVLALGAATVSVFWILD
jgi:putative membrane protein